jgi:uncharacterized membrane protein
MKKIIFPHPFKQDHSQIKNVNDLYEEKLTSGQRYADKVAHIMGSWRFVLIQSFLLFIWVVLNTAAWIYRWDPYPFILMNLVLSLQAAYTAPVIMMSQNRLAEKDRIDAHNDYLVNIKAEEEVRAILEHLHAQNEALSVILEKISNDEKK